MAVLVQARSGIDRSGASPANYLTRFKPHILINGTNRASTIKASSLQIHQGTNDEPDTASFTVGEQATWVPLVGQLVYIGWDAEAYYEFAGQISHVRHRRITSSRRPWFDVQCVDWQRLFDRHLVYDSWTSTSADDIVEDIISTYTSGFASTYVASGLATIDFFPATGARPSALLRRLANLIGGGYRIDEQRVVHFWGPSGDAYAGTAPVTLVDSLSSLKTFSHEYDNLEVRTRNLVRGASTTTLAPVASGQYTLPVASTADFSVIIADHDFVIPQYGRFTPAGSTLGPPDLISSTVNTAAAVGATTLKVDNVITGLDPLFPGWVCVGGDVFLYYTDTSVTASPVGNLTGIPASGPGSITRALAVGESVVRVGQIYSATAFSRQLEPGTTVQMLEDRNDTTAQTAVAAVEGGDGIHEFEIADGRLSFAGAIAVGDADLDQFANTGLLSAHWTTQDLNARPGRSQVINFTGTDALSSTVTVFRSDLKFFDRITVRPMRTCEGGTVKTQDLITRIVGE